MEDFSTVNICLAKEKKSAYKYMAIREGEAYGQMCKLTYFYMCRNGEG